MEGGPQAAGDLALVEQRVDQQRVDRRDAIAHLGGGLSVDAMGMSVGMARRMRLELDFKSMDSSWMRL